MFLGQSNTKLGRGPQCCSDFHRAKTAQNHGIVITLTLDLTRNDYFGRSRCGRPRFWRLVGEALVASPSRGPPRG